MLGAKHVIWYTTPYTSYPLYVTTSSQTSNGVECILVNEDSNKDPDFVYPGHIDDPGPMMTLTWL